MSTAAADSWKRSKKRYVAGRGGGGKRWKGSRELDVGMQGILITCNMNQRKCTAEAFNLLNEYADELYGPERFDQNGGSNSDEEEEDVDAALKQEVAQLKASGAQRERRFQALESGANNVVFIRTHNLESDKLVHHILTDLHTSKKKKSRVILRMLPVTGTCRAFQEDMMRYLGTFLEPWFRYPNKATYKVAFKARNSSHNKRDDVIKSIAGLVATLNPKNRVDLTKPQLTIIVEVIKAVCCVSVVRDYWLYKKYNLQEVAKEGGPEQAEAAEGGEDGESGRTAAHEKEEEKDTEVKEEEVEKENKDKVEEKENKDEVEEKEKEEVEKQNKDEVEEEVVEKENKDDVEEKEEAAV